MMPEEPEQSLRRAKRIRPGILLTVIVVIVSALLIYKIQSMESDRPYTESSSRQTAQRKSTSALSPENTKTHRDETGWFEEKPTPVLDPVTPEPDLVLTLTTNRQPLLPDVKTVEEGELNSTSWQNPFYNLFWKSKGWQFTEAGMVSTAGHISTATFVRPYKKISVSFRVDVKENFPSFELHLLTRDPANPEKVLIASAIVFSERYAQRLRGKAGGEQNAETGQTGSEHNRCIVGQHSICRNGKPICHQCRRTSRSDMHSACAAVGARMFLELSDHERPGPDFCLTH